MLQDYDKAIQTLESHLQDGPSVTLAGFIRSFHPGDIAYLASHINQDYLKGFLDEVQLHPELEEIIFLMEKEPTTQLVEAMPTSQIKDLFSKLDPDDSAKIIDQLPEELGIWALSHMQPEDSKETESLLEHDKETAGRIMSPDFFAMDEESTVLEAFTALKTEHEAETVYALLITDKRNHLVGVCSLRELLTQPNHKKLKEFMEEEVISVRADLDREEVAHMVERYKLNVLPVVSKRNKILGIITVDDVIQVIRSEATEDIMKLAGTTEEEFALQSPLKGFQRRMPWLMVSFFGGILTIQTNIYFSGKIPQVEFLAFITVIAGMGGNIASQSSTIVVRGLATGKILPSELWDVLYKEISIGVLLGLCFGALLGTFASFQFQHVPLIGFSVMAGMIFSMLIAATVGSLMPLIFHKFQIDPAVATGPFVSTTIDNLGLLGYFGSVFMIFHLFL
ncbi:MAG: magnesium transporter [SAR324 cluster bacterium]|nr:magnesium transporter [SAR324 cluster bacterium]